MFNLFSKKKKENYISKIRVGCFKYELPIRIKYEKVSEIYDTLIYELGAHYKWDEHIIDAFKDLMGTPIVRDSLMNSLAKYYEWKITE